MLGVDRRFLPQIAQIAPGRQRGFAGIRQLLAQQDAKQRRLAAAVAPDQAHLLPGGDAEVDFLEQQVGPVAFF